LVEVLSGSDGLGSLGIFLVGLAGPHPAALQTVRVPEPVQERKRIECVPPKHPEEALELRIQGKVRFAAVIGEEDAGRRLKLRTYPCPKLEMEVRTLEDSEIVGKLLLKYSRRDRCQYMCSCAKTAKRNSPEFFVSPSSKRAA
jgi:hypothetical protein